MANTALPPSSVVGAPDDTAADTGVGVETGSTGDTEIFPPFQELVELAGTQGNDVLLGTDKPEILLGYRGDDVLYGGEGDDQLEGGIGDDRLEGGPGWDFYNGGPGIDVLTFSVADGPANVNLASGSVIVGGAYEPVTEVENVSGSVFGDTLMGDDHDNVLHGGAGLDLLGGGLGDDVLNGGTGGAYATWAEQAGGVKADLQAGTATEWDGGRDTLLNVVGAIGTDFTDTIEGGDAANRIEGGGGADLLNGRAGDDILVGGEGADVMNGGQGVDTADYSSGGPVRASLQSGEAVDAGGARDQLNDIENLIGSLGQDVLAGDAGANRLEGGVGADILRGGGGADVFVFNDRLDFGDTIRDFQGGIDRIEISQDNLGGGSVIFDEAAGRLLWQEAGGDSAVLATVQGDVVATSDILFG